VLLFPTMQGNYNFQLQQCSNLQTMMNESSSTKSKSIMVDTPSVHFLDIIRASVAANKYETFASWYNNKADLTDQRTFKGIWERAGLVAYYLRHKWNVQKGQLVVLCYDFGLHFFEVFFGCLRAGVVAVLGKFDISLGAAFGWTSISPHLTIFSNILMLSAKVYPPSPPLKKSLTKLIKVIQDCDPILILTDSRVNGLRALDKRNPVSKSRGLWPKHVRFQVTDKLPRKSQLYFDEERSTGSDVAFLQYTSGSTGEPKGVIVTFASLKANVQLLQDGFYKGHEEYRGFVPEKNAGVSWLPQYHDLGLIYGCIMPIASGWQMHMISPISFIQKPLLWLELMSQYKCAWSIAPNFAYQLVTRKFLEARNKANGKEPIPGLDLSSIFFLASGAEPIRIDTKETFEATFNQFGLPKRWFATAYGLAEHVVGVSWISGQYVSKERAEDPLRYVAVGSEDTFYDSLVVKIVDPATCLEVEDRRVVARRTQRHSRILQQT